MSADTPSRVHAPPLSRDALAGQGVRLPDPPVRIVHLGLGAFHRAHQAWYTSHAADAHEWGIAAFTGRRADAASLLAPQDGLYTLVVRGPEGDRFEHIGNIVRVADGNDLDDFLRTVSSPDVAIVTITITEAGYRLTSDGHPDDTDPEVLADIQTLQQWLADRADALPAPRTTLARLLAGLELRRRAGAPPLAIVPCDNMPDNGALVDTALRMLAHRVSAELAAWLPDGISCVSTSVDRITPKLGADDRLMVEEQTGWADAAPVVTEPFSDWVLCGRFPSGRPAWETAGARFVDDIEQWEARKLWMLNGAHTLLACAGLSRGYDTVAAAMTDPDLVRMVESLWDDAARNVPDVETDRYRTSLADRFTNPRIVHRLSQIAQDSLLKVRVRIVPVAARERATGRAAAGAAAVVAAYLNAVGKGVVSSRGEISAAVAAARIQGAVALIDADLGRDEAFCQTVERAVGLVSSRPIVA